MVTQAPSIGRIVIYNLQDRQVPAIIVKVNDDNTVNLKVFDDCQENWWNKSCENGDLIGQWNWPSRV